MTKNARFGFWMLALAVSPLTFAGCGDDETPSDGKGGQGGSSTGGKGGTSGTSGTGGAGTGGKGTSGTSGTSGTGGMTGGTSPGGEGGMGGEGGGEGGMGGSGAADPGGRMINMTPARFSPEGVALDRNGNFYLGSMDLGLIYKAKAWDTNAVPFINSGDMASVLGMYAEDGDGSVSNPGTLWVCASDAGNSSLSGTQIGAKVALKAFNLMTGALVNSWAWPAPTPADPTAPAGINGFCNDIAIDAEGNVYATDSWYPRILRLPKASRTNTTPLEVWVTNPIFGADKWHLNGIDVDQATRSLYVVENHPGHLWRIPINTNGTPGTVQEITTSRPLGGPDGLKVIAPNLLATAESNGLSVVRVNGNNATVTEVFSGFDGYATLALHEGSAWVVENQGDHFWDAANAGPNADPPFRLLEVPLPPNLGAGLRNINTSVARFFSEGVTVSGTNLYVGSMDTGAIHRAAVTATATAPFITRDTTNNLASVIGMYAHTATNRLYVCSSETTAMGTPASATTLKAFNLTSGAFIASWAWPAAPGTKHAGTTAEGFCNDITVSADGYTVFATDSWYPRIVRVAGAGAAPAATDALTSWYTSTLFPQDQWHLNGLDLAPGGSSIYVVENHPGGLWRVPINSVSGAGETAVQITTSRPIRGPDGLKVIDADTLAIAESTGGMALIELTGNTGAVRTISTGLDGVATFALLNNNAWIVENQADHFWGASDPQGPNANKPFRLVETPLGLP